ncbi:gamma-glutamylcyclotransferase [Halosegnis sp.]|uniref:gamma-glutamylcyclotransferase family protein n=1 Tax=Halosegnis sp. TaxID=2864959 RepID=UPI0035D4FC01
MDCFVYGTLTDPERATTVVPDAQFGPDACLKGLHRVEGQYPTLAPGGQTTGRILRTDAPARLDEYEGVDRGLYTRVTAPGETGDVTVYVGDPARLDAPVEWPGEGPFGCRVKQYVHEADVRVRVTPSSD